MSSTSINIILVIISRGLKQAQHTSRIEDRRGARRDLVGKPEKNRIFGRPRRRWDDDIKMNLL